MCKAQSSLFKISRDEAGGDGYRASWRVMSDYGRICLRWQRTVRSSLYGSIKRAMRMADAIFAPGRGHGGRKSSGGGDSERALAQEIRACGPGVEKTAKNPILAAASGDACNHW